MTAIAGILYIGGYLLMWCVIELMVRAKVLRDIQHRWLACIFWPLITFWVFFTHRSSAT